MTPALKLLDKVGELLRLKHYSPKTEESYSDGFNKTEVNALLAPMTGVMGLMARLMEWVTLRVKDIDLAQPQRT